MANAATGMGTDDGGHDDDGELIFQWERRARSRWRLALMLTGALLLHAVTFYVLQVAYTPTGTQLPPPAQVVLVPLDQPENAPLARWLTMNDPALAMRPTAVPATQVLASLGFHYVPSYDAAQPPFKPLSPGGGLVNAAAPRPSLPGPVPVWPVPTATSARVPSTNPHTQVVLTGPVLAPAGALPPVTFNAGAGTTLLNPTVFVVAARRDGGAPLLFRQATSGNAAADEYARGYLAALGLQQASTQDGVAWGMASFYWGNDVYR